MSLARQQIQYLTTRTRTDLERVIAPDKLKYEVDKAVAKIVVKDLADNINTVNNQIAYGQFPNGDAFMIAIAQVESSYEVFKILMDDVIASRQITLPKLNPSPTENSGIVNYSSESHGEVTDAQDEDYNGGDS